MVDPCKGPLRSHECEDLAPPSLYPPPPPLPPPPSAASHGRSTFVTALIIASSVLAFLALCVSVFLFVRRSRHRRRQRQRQREALGLEAALAAPPGDGGDGGPAEEEVVHHAWHIRTVGLDETAIESIALARYRAGAAASDDCTVCLGEFRDGELLRLLPKCAHAFHVRCIDTWLRAHVTCPLCLANVIDTSAAAAAGDQPGPAPPAPGAGAEQEEHDAGNVMEREQQPGSGQRENEQRFEIDQRDHHQPGIVSSEQPRQRPCPRPRTFRRVASMDSPPSPVASAEEARLEHGQAGGEKQGAGGAVCCGVSPGSDDHLNRAGAAMKRSLSAGSRWTLLSRPCRQRSSLLPL
ncbi:unnamed protein product [Urochloa humidicola]